MLRTDFNLSHNCLNGLELVVVEVVRVEVEQAAGL